MSALSPSMATHNSSPPTSLKYRHPDASICRNLPTPPTDDDNYYPSNRFSGEAESRFHHWASLSSPQSPDSTILPDLDVHARRLFYQKYVCVSSDEDIDAAWSFMYGNGCLRASVEAVGFIELSRRTPNDVTLQEAEHRYVLALQLTNDALCSDEWMTHDSTLLAVNVLGIYETINPTSQNMLGGWARHVMGAAALLQGRGAAQFERDMGGQLFMQNVWNLSWLCLWKTRPLPQHILDLNEIASQHIVNPQDRHWRYHCIILRLVDMYTYRPPPETVYSVEEVQRIIDSAMQLDDDFIDFTEQDTKKGWAFKTLEAQGTAVLTGRYHVYSHFHTARMWNGIRCARILLADLILRTIAACNDSSLLEHLTYQQQVKIQGLPTLVIEMQHGILASIPQHVGLDFPTARDTHLPDDLWANFALADQAAFRFNQNSESDIPRLRQNGGYSLQVPIYIAGAADQSTQGTIRSFSMTALNALDERYGVRAASVLSQCLEQHAGANGYGLGRKFGLFSATAAE